MRSLLLAVLAAYLIAAIHSILAFVNKRRSLQRVAEWSTAAGFILHAGALAADWVIDGHYPLFSLREALSFLAWALVALSNPGSRRFHNAVGFHTDTRRVIIRHEFVQRASRLLSYVAVPDTYHAPDLCLRGIFHRLHGECDVLTPGARTQTENLWRDVPSSAVFDYS